MAEIRLEQMGKIGLVKDTKSTIIPQEALTDLFNVHTEDGSIVSTFGMKKVLDCDIRPLYHTIHARNDTREPWVIISDGEKIYAYALLTPDTSEEITPASGDWSDGFVSFADLNGILVINSASDGPYYWPGPTNILVKVPGPGDGDTEPANGWNWTLGWRCKEMDSYRYNLIALNMTEDENEFPYKIRWSTSAEEGAIPTEWKILAGNDAGDDILGETQGAIVGGTRVRNRFFIIKEDSVYELRWIGGQYIMATERLLEGTAGTDLQWGYKEALGTLAIYNTGDFILFDGQTTFSPIEGVIRRALVSLVKDTSHKKSRVFFFEPLAWLILAVPDSSGRLRHAFIYDMRNKTWGHKQIINGYGFESTLVYVSGGEYVWDDLGPEGEPHENPSTAWIPGKVWDEQTAGPWNKGAYLSATPDLLVFESNDADTDWWLSVAGPGDGHTDGSPITCKAERIGLPIEGAHGLAMVTEAIVEASGRGDVNLTIQFGGQETLDDFVNWDPVKIPIQFGVSEVLDPRVTGRFIAYRIESNGLGSWNIPAITIRWQNAGER